MEEWKIRARGVVTGNFGVVVACLLVLAAAGGWVTYTTYLNPGTHTEERVASSWETAADFDHAATVREPNSVYSVGTTLENRSAYFGSVAPVLDANFTYGYTASESGSLTLVTDADLVLQSVQRNESGGVEARYWRKTRDLAQTRASGVEPGDAVGVPFAFNVSAVANESSRVEEELGASVGETEALVRVSVTLTGTVNGESRNRTEQYVLPVEFGDAYVVNDPGTVRERYTSTSTATVPNQYGPLRRLGGPLLLVAGLGGVVGLVLVRRSGHLSAPTPAEREYLSFQEARSDFDEWVHRIELPPSAVNLPRAEAESLSDLVDFAIDTNSGVVEDAEAGTYYVVHDGYLYSYSPPDGADPASGSEAGVRPRPNDGESVSPPDASEDTESPESETEPPTGENES
jgi:hypothetical protein